MQTRFQPWRDRSGRLSWLKLAVFALLFVPGLMLAVQFQVGALAPKPVTELIHQTGFWAVRLLLLSLLVSPLRTLGNWPKLILVRRMLGVAVLAYALVHFSLYIVDQHGDLTHVASEIALRFYLTIGFVALLGLAVLGATSTDAAIRRLGAHRWNRLHQVVYGIGVLALWHFLLQAKLDITQPVLMAGLFFVLVEWRVLRRLRRADSLGGLIGVTVIAALLTAGLEAGWYHVVNHVPTERVLLANLDTDDGLRPALWVAIAGLSLAALRLMRPLWSKKRTPGVRERAKVAG